MEPEYEYVKGQGWVIVTCPTMTVRVGKYLVTGQRRPARQGERGWVGDMAGNLNFISRDFQWSKIFAEGEDTIKRMITPFTRFNVNGSAVTVVTWKET